MAAAKLDLLIEQGSTFSYELTINNPGTPLVPIDLTAWTFTGQVRKTFDAATVVATFTFVKADQTTDPGKVVMSLTAVQTSAIPALKKLTDYVYDIEAVYSTTTKRLLEGKATLSAEVTR